MRFIAFWPITDEAVPFRVLRDQAAAEVPALAAQAHARITGRCRWTIRDSAAVPGSGRVTDTVLVCEAPAVEHVPAWRLGRAS